MHQGSCRNQKHSVQKGKGTYLSWSLIRREWCYRKSLWKEVESAHKHFKWSSRGIVLAAALQPSALSASYLRTTAAHFEAWARSNVRLDQPYRHVWASVSVPQTACAEKQVQAHMIFHPVYLRPWRFDVITISVQRPF
jgi:hypothetical protein